MPDVAFRSADPCDQLGYATDEYGFDVREELKLLRGDEHVDEMLIGCVAGECIGGVVEVEVRLDVEEKDICVSSRVGSWTRYISAKRGESDASESFVERMVASSLVANNVWR